MRTFSYNNLNQLSGGGAGGALPVTVRGQTNEAATMKAKRSGDPDWKNARQLSGNRFEADLTLASGSNQLDIQATDGSANQSNYLYLLNLAAQAVAAPTYDADGNMLSDGSRSYSWDRQSRLVKITWGGSPLKTTMTFRRTNNQASRKNFTIENESRRKVMQRLGKIGNSTSRFLTPFTSSHFQIKL